MQNCVFPCCWGWGLWVGLSIWPVLGLLDKQLGGGLEELPRGLMRIYLIGLGGMKNHYEQCIKT